MSAHCNAFDFILGLLQVGSTEDGDNTTAWLPEVTKLQKRFSGKYTLFNEFWLPAVRMQVDTENFIIITMIVVIIIITINSYTAYFQADSGILCVYNEQRDISILFHGPKTYCLPTISVNGEKTMIIYIYFIAIIIINLHYGTALMD